MKRVLLSVGPMRSPIDPVRYLQNRSSGKMGLALAEALHKKGYHVSVLLGPVSEEIEKRFQRFSVTRYTTASEYQRHLKRLFPKADLFFSLAAVLDFEVVPSKQKIPRSALRQKRSLSLEIRPVPDCVALCAARKRADQRVIAFAAETGTVSQIQKRGRRKLLQKKVDALLVNPVTQRYGPEKDWNCFWLLQTAEKPHKIGPDAKDALANPVVEALRL